MNYYRSTSCETNVVYFQPILSSSKHTDKSFFYKLMDNFLGTGLVTSNGGKFLLAGTTVPLNHRDLLLCHDSSVASSDFNPNDILSLQ
uniref:Uncharacterized protein n=1 Tax=Timema monikensis TaxID=170555 RepID=A0A7R9E9Z3_9NEOP|nr:unnamed protein product [Timema monikensis]